MGVDGHSSTWFVYKPIEQTFTLLPDSPSNEIFETWAAQERTNHDLYVANGSALLTSAGEKYIMTRGYMTKRQPGKYTITWQSVKATAI